MRNVLQVVTDELEAYGIKPKVEQGRKHYKVKWEYQGKHRQVAVSVSPSDHRSALNSRGIIRRYLREDGLIARKTHDHNYAA